MYNARLEQSTQVQRVLRTTVKAMSDAMLKEDAARRRARATSAQAKGMSIREQLKQQGLVRDSKGVIS